MDKAQRLHPSKKGRGCRRVGITAARNRSGKSACIMRSGSLLSLVSNFSNRSGLIQNWISSRQDSREGIASRKPVGGGVSGRGHVKNIDRDP